MYALSPAHGPWGPAHQTQAVSRQFPKIFAALRNPCPILQPGILGGGDTPPRDPNPRPPGFDLVPELLAKDFKPSTLPSKKGASKKCPQSGVVSGVFSKRTCGKKLSGAKRWGIFFGSGGSPSPPRTNQRSLHTLVQILSSSAVAFFTSKAFAE